jgi:hypothetical protein
MADNNLVVLFVRLNSGLKQDYGSKTRERKNNDTKDRSFDVASSLPFVAMLSHWCVYIPLNGLAVPCCRINVPIEQAKVIKDNCLK